MDQILAPAQLYALLAIAATVGSIVNAFAESLLPDRVTLSDVTPSQTLAGDSRVIDSRRFLLYGFMVLIFVSWLNIVVVMTSRLIEWSVYHWMHFIGLLVLLAIALKLISLLSNRFSVTPKILLTPPDDTSVRGPTAG